MQQLLFRPYTSKDYDLGNCTELSGSFLVYFWVIRLFPAESLEFCWILGATEISREVTMINDNPLPVRLVSHFVHCLLIPLERGRDGHRADELISIFFRLSAESNSTHLDWPVGKFKSYHKKRKAKFSMIRQAHAVHFTLRARRLMHLKCGKSMAVEDWRVKILLKTYSSCFSFWKSVDLLWRTLFALIKSFRYLGNSRWAVLPVHSGRLWKTIEKNLLALL